MRKVAAIEAETSLGRLLDIVEQGEDVVITRHGEPVARIVREPGRGDRAARARAAAERIRALARDAKLGPFAWEEWRDARDDGRV
ncbi:MAG: type II toxin-antitoxin system Phd/YefM family antitoxin [Rhodospirillales bacterium]|jgi:antitoxin (DNA-binding transcriptional repressor) of toxin-antitoxin stability system